MKTLAECNADLEELHKVVEAMREEIGKAYEAGKLAPRSQREIFEEQLEIDAGYRAYLERRDVLLGELAQLDVVEGLNEENIGDRAHELLWGVPCSLIAIPYSNVDRVGYKAVLVDLQSEGRNTAILVRSLEVARFLALAPYLVHELANKVNSQGWTIRALRAEKEGLS